MMDVVDTFQHNIVIIQKEMIKSPVSLQKKIDTHNMHSVMEALTEVIKTAAFFSVNRQKLVVLAQSRQTSDDDDGELFACVGETYQSHNSDIVDVLTELLNKAQFEIRRYSLDAKSNVAHNFAMLMQFLEDQLTQDNKALEKAKADKTEFAAALATEKVDLAEASKSLVSLKASQAVALDHETLIESICGGVEDLSRSNAGDPRSDGQSQEAHVFTIPSKFICWLADEDQTQRIQSGEHGEEARQAGALSE